LRRLLAPHAGRSATAAMMSSLITWGRV
jgi:hypothetical protein